jgi:isopentenyldiphosphate isomerase
MSIQEQKILETIEEFAKKLPRFSDGRIDYSKSDTAPVITVFIKYRDKILLLKRSGKVSTYQRKWNTVAGYLDESKPIYEKILEEIREELGIDEDNILSYNFGKSYKFTDPMANKTWIVHPVLVELKNKPIIKLDWEHTEYKWIKPEELKNFDIVFKIDESLKRALN